MRNVLIYIVAVPAVFLLSLAFFIWVFFIPTESGLILAASVGASAAIAGVASRFMRRQTAEGAAGFARDERRLIGLVRQHDRALSAQMESEIVRDPYGKAVKDKSKRVIDYFVKSTGYRSSFLTRLDIHRIVRREIAALRRL